MRRVSTRPVAPAPIGLAVPRRDGVAKVTGSGRFTVDLGMAGLAHAKLLRSPYPHARIRSIERRRPDDTRASSPSSRRTTCPMSAWSTDTPSPTTR